MERVNNNLDRRKFLKMSGITGAALAIGFNIPFSNGGNASIQNLNSDLPNGVTLNAFIIIEKTGKITLINPRPDMGQGSFQAVPALIAEELEVSLDQVEIKNSDGSKKYGSQLSGGSSSIRGSWEPLRKAGAAAKEMLIKAASSKWKIKESDCYALEGKIFDKTSKRSLSYGALVEEAAKLEVPENPKLKEPKDFKLLGKDGKRPDIPLKVDGEAVFGLDYKVPGMLYASIERSPVFNGRVAKYDDSKTKQVKGVIAVLKCERPMPHRKSESVAVIADNYFSAIQGRKALQVTWDDGEFGNVDSEGFFESLRNLAKSEGAVHHEKGEFEKTFNDAPKKLEFVYETPFLAHAPMEPENALAHVKKAECEIWAPVQGPDWLVDQVSKYLNIQPEKVKVNVTFLGGAFGRKAYYDYVLEAVHLSQKLNAPVKVIWSREDDTSLGPFRPGLISALKGGLDLSGNVVAFQHKVVAPSIQHQLYKSLQSGKSDGWAMEAIEEKDSPYKIPNVKYNFVLAETDIPIVWWRSVYASSNIFGHESFIDELAHASKKDPLKFRMEMLKDAPRHLNVLKILEEKSGWNQSLPSGKARGVAISRSFETICAHVVTVSKNDSGIKIEKVVSVMDCGMTVNPDNVKAQTEGNIIMGITAAIKDAITFKSGRAEQTNFHNYRVLRINETPEMEMHIVQNFEKPGGVGEPGLPPVAPALTNAIFNLTGKRIRKLPFNLNEV
ncbi:MAG TPA: molybdopterin cofactor-binding domain-containing protein [Cytophagales bacterium]|nr:molybdopterin cofactor-binding domain-containing protein [Cytophagales bacterium]